MNKNKALAGLALLWLAQSATAYEWSLGPQPIRERPYYVAEDTCGQAADDIRWAAEVWNFYVPARFLEVKTPARDDRFLQVQCQDQLFFDHVLFKSGQDGMAYWWWNSEDQITSAELVFNTDRYRPRACNFLHEFGHSLGLAHAGDGAAMEPGSGCRYLTAEDIAGAAALFDVAPNCTPYVTEDLVAYFPFIGGEWLELRPVDRQDPLAGFYEAGRGASIDHGWECALEHGEGAIEAEMYYRGKVVEVRLQQSGGVWTLAP